MQLTNNFSLSEFACHDGTQVPDKYFNNVVELANNLQVLRDKIDTPIRILSGYRSPEWNAKIGGAELSQHMTASAADICVDGYTPKKLHKIIEELIASGKMKQGGLGLYSSWVHYDVRGTKARWQG